MNKIITYEEIKIINSITYSINSCWSTGEQTFKLINNYEKIICEYYFNKELKKVLEIEQEIWKEIINKLFKIIKQRNYYWNKQYSVIGNEKVFDVSPWKMEVENKTNECFKINCKGKAPEIFSELLLIIWDIYYKKIEDKKE